MTFKYKFKVVSPYVAKILVIPVILSLKATRISFRFLRLVLSKTPQFILALMAIHLSKEVELWYDNLNLYSIIIYIIILFSLTCKYTTCLVIPPGFISGWPSETLDIKRRGAKRPLSKKKARKSSICQENKDCQNTEN